MSVNGRRNVVAVIWVAVGVLLFWRGMPYLGLSEDPDIVGLTGSDTWIALAIAVVVGVGKGMTALRKAARRLARRIEDQGEQAPAWKIFPPVMFLLVGLMIAAGLALRLAPYDDGVKAWVVGSLYPAIALALVIGGVLVRTVEPLPAPEPSAAS